MRRHFILLIQFPQAFGQALRLPVMKYSGCTQKGLCRRAETSSWVLLRRMLAQCALFIIPLTIPAPKILPDRFQRSVARVSLSEACPRYSSAAIPVPATFRLSELA